MRRVCRRPRQRWIIGGGKGGLVANSVPTGMPASRARLLTERSIGVPGDRDRRERVPRPELRATEPTVGEGPGGWSAATPWAP